VKTQKLISKRAANLLTALASVSFKYFWAVMLLDVGHRYDPFAKRIISFRFLEFGLGKKYSNSRIQISIF
jgi:hypothetical protein